MFHFIINHIFLPRLKSLVCKFTLSREKITIYFNFTGRVQGDKAILPKNYFTEGSRDSFLAENLTSVAREVFSQKRVEGTQGKVIFAKLLCLTTLPGKLKYVILSTAVILSKCSTYQPFS